MKTWSLVLVATSVGSATAGVLLARAQSGEPPVIGPTAKPELTVSTEKPAEKAADPATPPAPVKTVYTDCHDELTQAAEEIEWWREQLALARGEASPTSSDPNGAAATPSSPATPGAPGTTAPAPTTTATGPNALPTATALMAAADPRLAAVPLTGVPVEGGVPIPSPLGVLDRPRLKQVAALIKDMKPRDAAEVVAGLDDNLAVGVLARMAPKSASAITAALPPEHAARLLTQLSVLPIPTEPEE